MVKSEINISFKRNMDLPIDKKWLERMARKVLEREGISSPVELGLLITDSRTAKKLNRIYRGKDEPTDVLSFHMTPDGNRDLGEPFVSPPDGIRHLGEVVISYPQAARQAQEHGHGVKQELALLVIHGILHLLGYDHELSDEEKKMRDKENEILSAELG